MGMKLTLGTITVTLYGLMTAERMAKEQAILLHRATQLGVRA
jgi:hypothetical protein